MDLPEQFRELPPWAALVVALGGALFVVSVVLGIVSAGIAIGIELGSATAGVLAVLGGLTLVVVPLLVVVYLWSSRSEPGETDEAGRTERDDRVEALRERYVAGEIDEEAFERRVADLLGDSPGADTAQESVELQGRPDSQGEYELE